SPRTPAATARRNVESTPPEKQTSADSYPFTIARRCSSFGSIAIILSATAGSRHAGHTHRRDEDVGHLGAAELLGRPLAGAEEVAHLGPGQKDVVRLVVRAGLAGGHPAAAPAEEAVLEAERGDADLLGRVAVEDLLRVVGAVVVADAGVIASDDEVGAA